MTENGQTPNDRAAIAAKHLVGNLWFNLEAVPLIAGRLSPETMTAAVGGDTAMAYAEMCNLLRSKETKLTSGQLEANLTQKGFDKKTLAGWQSDLTNDSIDDLHQYIAEIQNVADLHKLETDCVQALRKTKEPTARAESIKAELLAEMVRTERADGGPRHVSEIIGEVRPELHKAQDGTGDWGASTGLSSLDKVFKMVDGNYITIGARPSQGKTSLAIWIAFRRAEQLKKAGEDGQVLIFSLDDTSRKLVRALACTLAMVDNNKLKNGEATVTDWQEMDRAQDYIETLPIWIDDSPGLTVEDMYYRTAMQNVSSPVRLIVVDYFEKIRSKGRATDELIRLKAIANDTKSMGKDFSCPVLMLSQLTKEVEKRADKWPTSSDLRYAGEDESDVVALLNRPEHYISKGEHIDCKPEDEEGIVMVNVAKNKEGNVGLVRLGFKKEYARFADLQFERINLNE